MAESDATWSPVRHARPAPKKLGEPLRWRKPRRIFVNSMSDLFHEDISSEYIAAVFGVMAACPHHTFQVLTKRPELMTAWFEWVAAEAVRLDSNVIDVLLGCASTHTGLAAGGLLLRAEPGIAEDGECWPLPGVGLGVSVEDQRRADERIPLLLRVPAAVRFVYDPGRVLVLRDPKGGDPAEWPQDLRVREFPR
jgi:protein gp37